MATSHTLVTSLLSVSFIVLFLITSFITSLTETDESNDLVPGEFGANLSQLIELRGYKAHDHFVTTPDGYILNLVEIVNPAIIEFKSNNKDPLLFIHGSICNGKFFVINSAGAKPKNYAHLNISSLSQKQINKLFKDDSKPTSLPFAASDFGHSVWIMNRRGGQYSQKHINMTAYKPGPIASAVSSFFGLFGKTGKSRTNSNNSLVDRPNSKNYNKFKVLRDIIFKNPKFNLNNIENQFNRKYWNWTLDDEAKFDIPCLINYVLNKTGRERVSLVGHSAGSNLSLMSMIVHPELQDKIRKSVLWAPAMVIYSRRSTFISHLHEIPFRLFIGPAPPSTFIPLIQNAIAAECLFPLVRNTICKTFFDGLLGEGGDQQILSPSFATSLFDSFGSHSVVSLLQTAIYGKQRFYDYKDERKNMIAYNQTEPPLYDVTKVRSKGISFWAGGTDGIIPPASIETLANEMRVPIETHYINQSGVYFNHGSFLFHRNISDLLILPSLITLESP